MRVCTVKEVVLTDKSKQKTEKLTKLPLIIKVLRFSAFPASDP